MSRREYRNCFGEGSAERKSRLLREGRWRDFVSHRDMLKASGVPYQEAYVQAASRFLPLNEDGTIKQVEGALVAPVPQDRRVTLPHSEGPFEGEAAQSSADAITARLDEQVPAPPPAEEVVERPTPRNSAASRIGFDLPLMSLEMASQKKAPLMDAIQWVSEHLAVRGVKPEHAPSAQAWAMYCWANSSPQMRKEFWSRVMPSKVEIDKQIRMSDTGVNVEELIEKFAEHRNLSVKCPSCGAMVKR